MYCCCKSLGHTLISLLLVASVFLGHATFFAPKVFLLTIYNLQSRLYLLTALIEYLAILLEYLNLFANYVAGYSKHLGGLGPCQACTWLHHCLNLVYVSHVSHTSAI